MKSYSICISLIILFAFYFKVYACWHRWQNVLLYGWKAFPCVSIQHSFPFIYWSLHCFYVLALQNLYCNEHGYADIFLKVLSSIFCGFHSDKERKISTLKSMKGCRIYSYIFFPLSLLMYCTTYIKVNLQIPNQLNIPKKYPTWPWCIQLMYCWIQFTSIVLEIFSCAYIKILACSLLFFSFSQFSCSVFVWLY